MCIPSSRNRTRQWNIASGMLQILHNKGLAAYITSPISKEQLELCGLIYVDDSDMIADSGYTNNPELTLERMKKY